MGDVVDLNSRRPPKPQSLEEIFDESVEIILENWERAEKANRLNDFIIESVSWAADQEASYTADLNKISTLETVLGIEPVVFGPNSSKLPIKGWTAGFNQNGSICMNGLGFLSEAYARCFNLLVHQRVKRQLTL